MQDHASDLLAASIGKNMMIGGSSSALFFGGLAVSDIAAIVGVLIGVIGMCIQFYYKRRADKREFYYKRRADERDAEYHAAQMADLKRHG